MIYEPFPYQVTGAKWLATTTQALLADDMGLGKTSQAIRGCDLVGALRILVLAPAAARINWDREFHRFSPFDRPSAVILTGKDKIEADGVTVVSYDLLANAAVYKQLMAVQWDVLILDEAHFLKERTSKRTKAVYGNGRKQLGLVSVAKRCWRLSGTPAPNNVSELWTHLRSGGIVDLSYWDFTFLYTKGFDAGFGYQITATKNEAQLKQLLAGFMLRRKKDDVLKDLPPITFSEVTVERSEVELDPYFYENWRVDGQAKFLQTLKQHNDTLAHALAAEADYAERRKQTTTASSIAILEGLAGSMATLRRYLGLAKLPKMLEHISAELEAGAYDKIVIFAIHMQVIEGARDYFDKKGFRPVTLYGNTPAERRQKNIDRFQTDPTTRVFIGNIQAAGTAITLTAASEVAFFEASWVPADNAQACMRCHRIGQENPVRVRFFSCAGSVDEKVMSVLAKKTREIAKVID